MTYSIVARCPETGRLGVAVQSHFFSVGSVVPWVEAGVGAVATQAMAEVAHGFNGLERLRAGVAPTDALDELIGNDQFGQTRQVALVDAAGRAGAHTGELCIREAGHVVGDGFTTQANMMERARVPEAMADAYTATGGPLTDRLLAALDAAEAMGGDIRGRQSAALVLAPATRAPTVVTPQLLDLRVEDHVDPLGELRRLVSLGMSYRQLDEAETAMSALDNERALEIYAAATRAHPDNTEFRFWHAITLAALGRIDEARATMQPVLAREDGERWRELLRRLPPTSTVSVEAAAALCSD